MVNLLLNVLIILVCILSYFVFSMNRKLEEKYRYFLISTIAMVAIYLCIKFPFIDLGDHSYDLRIIPFIVGALYGGRKVGVTLLIAILFFRYILVGVDLGLSITIVQVLIIWIFTILIGTNFIHFSLSKKLAIPLNFLVFIYIVNFAIVAMFFTELINRYFLTILLTHFLILFFTLALTIYLIEYILNTVFVNSKAVHESVEKRSTYLVGFSHDIVSSNR
ncbi:hypothetical protein RJD24_17260 [Bacillaceae bacterium IKA-2]|nr:hypothetical protein RJD24_17260 [Bacillaceae bacterium IKA-2]